VGITDAQAQQQPVAALVVEPFVAGEQQLADAIERVVLAASMAQRLVLHPPADLVQAPVADPDHVKWICHSGGVVQLGRQPGPEGLGQVGGHHLDAGDPVRIGVLGPSSQVSGRVAPDHVDEHLGPQVDQASGVDGGVGPVGGQERGLVHPELLHGADAPGVVDERRAVFDHRVHHRPPAHAQLGRHPRHRPGPGPPDGTPRPRPGG